MGIKVNEEVSKEKGGNRKLGEDNVWKTWEEFFNEGMWEWKTLRQQESWVYRIDDKEWVWVSDRLGQKTVI